MNLLEFMKEKKAKESLIRGESPYLKLEISSKLEDRFCTCVAVFKDDPEVLYVLRFKMSGVHIISNDDVLLNHNCLHTNFKKAYIRFIKNLEINHIKFEINNINY